MKKDTSELCLASQISSFIKLKQALGRRFTAEQRVLQLLNEFMIASGATDLTHAEFERWCKTLTHLTPTVRRNRMRIVRNFCLYRTRTEPNGFVPDSHLFPALHQAIRPHIYSEDEIIRLLDASSRLRAKPRSPLLPEVYRLAIVLLYTSGLRRGELVRLKIDDYNRSEHTLHIRASKFHKSRFVPLSADACRETEAYLTARRRLCLPMLGNSALLWNDYDHECYTGGGLGRGLQRLLRSTSIRKTDGTLPRVHDFRFSFAVQVLLRWYRTGIDIHSKLPMLAAYMGHVSIVSTEYYLPFIPELAAEASAKFSSHYGALIQPWAGGGTL
jgi:integrase/recombinase XerD